MSKALHIEFDELQKLKTEDVNFCDSIVLENVKWDRLTSTRNTKILFEYLWEIGFKPKDIFSDKIAIPYEYLNSTQNWISLEEFFAVWEVFADFMKILNPRNFMNIGTSLAKRNSVGPFVDTLTNFLTVRQLINGMHMFDRIFNNDSLSMNAQNVILPGEKKRYRATVKYKFLENFLDIMPFRLEWYVKGMHSGIPLTQNMAQGVIDQIFSSFDIFKLLNEEYQYMNYIVKQVEDEILVDNEVCVQKDFMKRAEGDRLEVCDSNVAEFEVWRVVKSLFDINNDPVIVVGEVYNAPYMCWDITYTDISFAEVLLKRMKNIFLPEADNLHGELLLARETAYDALQKKKVAERERALALKAKEESDRKSRIFKVYTRSSLVDQVDNGNDPTLLNPKERQLAVLFNDIRDFTDLSENLSPREVVEFLNDYFNRVNQVIHDNNGEIDKLIGDCIMAAFESSDDAVTAAVNGARRLQKYNQVRARHNLPLVRSGIGVTWGSVISGNIGSSSKMDYTVIGDTVNTASRLEALTKYYGCGIIVSENVIEHMERSAEYRFIDVVKVKGSKKPIKIYEVFDHLPGFIKEKYMKVRAGMKEAYELYQTGNLLDADWLYGDLMETVGYHNYNKGRCFDPVLEFYKRRCESLSEQVRQGQINPSSWTGIFEFKDK